MTPQPRRRSCRRTVAIPAIAIASAILVPTILNGAPPFTLPNDTTTAAGNYHVHHSANATGNPQTGATTGPNPHFVAAAQAQRMADALSNGNAATAATPNGYHNAYAGMNFLAPDFGGANRDIWAWGCTTCDSGNAPSNEINMPVSMYATAPEACVRGVLGHELLHHVQYAYITFGRWSTWGGDPVEGTARVMQDKAYGDLDAQASTTCPGDYINEINGYLSSGRSSTLFGQSYGFALFWNYLMERLGTDRSEPHVGADFIRQFWVNAQAAGASVDFPGTLRRTIRDFDTNATLEDLFHDFTIANATKSLDVTPLVDGARYRYVDEQAPNTSKYGAISFDDTRSVTATTPAIPVKDIPRFSTRYLEAKVGPDCQVAGLRADGDRLAYGLAAISGNQVVRLDKAVTDHFKRGLLVRHPGGVEGSATRLVAVVTGLDSGGTTEAKWVCGQATLSIVDPNTAKPVIVGTKTDPGRFIVRLRVGGPSELGAPSIEGLRASDFTAWVGAATNADKATIVSSSYVQGEYWLVVKAPVKGTSAPDLNDLVVRLGDRLTETQSKAIRYGVRQLDQVVVIDRSGSMLSPAGSPKIDAARSAAGLYVDAARDTDRLGVVSFAGDNVEPNDDATLDALLTPLTPTARTAARTATQAVTAAGFTSIGDGMQKAVDEFAIRGNPASEHAAVLLSDGMENEARFWSSVAPGAKSAGVAVDTIALGPNTDQVLLQKIASDTGGSYHYVEVSAAAAPSARPAARAAAPAAAPAAAAPTGLGNRLADAFLLSSERVQGLQRVWEHADSLAGGASVDLPIAIDEDRLTTPVLSINWASAKGKLDAKLTDAAGNAVAGVSRIDDATHIVLRAPDLVRGAYRLHLEGIGTPGTFLAVLSGSQEFGARLDMRIGDLSRHSDFGDEFLLGLPIRVVSTLSDDRGPITGASVVATVTHPDERDIRLRLLDDGAHGDGQPGDGVYANSYTRTTQETIGRLPDLPGTGTAGSYQVVVNAAGSDHFKGHFDRIAKGSVAVTEHPGIEGSDRDGDGIPERYQALHPCLAAGTAGDPDADGLDTLDEYQIGTDPCSVDTDRGGEPDASEVKNGRNPFDPLDDALPRPIDPSVIVGPFDHIPNPGVVANANLIRYPASPEYLTIRLFRSTSPSGPFAKVADFAAQAGAGRYLDAGLVNGTTYYYALSGVDANGVESVRSPVFSGTPLTNPNLPIVDVVVNDWRSFTATRDVALRLTAPPSVRSVQVSNSPSFAAAIWKRYAPSVRWTLAPVSGPARVYVRVRDASGNVSQPASGNVTISGGLGLIRGQVKPNRKPASGSLAGMLVWADDHPEVPPVVTNAAGTFRFVDVPAGSYAVRAKGVGYAATKAVDMSPTSSGLPAGSLAAVCLRTASALCKP